MSINNMPRAKKARGFFHVRPGKRAQVIITAAGSTPRSFMRPSGSSGIAPEYGREMSHTSRPVQSLRALVS